MCVQEELRDWLTNLLLAPYNSMGCAMRLLLIDTVACCSGWRIVGEYGRASMRDRKYPTWASYQQGELSRAW